MVEASALSSQGWEDLEVVVGVCHDGRQMVEVGLQDEKVEDRFCLVVQHLREESTSVWTHS